MAIALITAGGVGARTGKVVPKQYLTVNDIPIIVYTMKNIQRSMCYDELYIVCSDGWKDFVWSYALQYNIDILCDTFSGGNTRFQSVYNGLKELNRTHKHNEVISILDGNRPMTPLQIFQDAVNKADIADCVIPLEECFDSMYYAEKANERIVNETLDRTKIFKGQSPETSTLGVAYSICEEAMNLGCVDKTLTALMLNKGKKVVFSEGSPLNFKITTSEDIQLFKALIDTETFKI